MQICVFIDFCFLRIPVLWNSERLGRSCSASNSTKATFTPFREQNIDKVSSLMWNWSRREEYFGSHYFIILKYSFANNVQLAWTMQFFHLTYSPYGTIKDHLTVPCLVVRPLNIRLGCISQDYKMVVPIYICAFFLTEVLSSFFPGILCEEDVQRISHLLWRKTNKFNTTVVFYSIENNQSIRIEIFMILIYW